MKFISTLIACAPAVSALWPIPTTYTYGDSVLFINKNTPVTYNGKQTSLASVSTNSFAATSYGSSNGSVTGAQIVATAIQRTSQTIFNQNYVPWKFYPRNADFEPSSNSTGNVIKSIKLVQNASDPADIGRPAVGDIDESYTLDVTTDGSVVISAKSSQGIAHGLTTFTQLFYQYSSGGAYTPLAPVSITDAPKFAYRSLQMDTARAFYPVPDVLRMIDAAAYNKFNHFHMHATDSQSWPLEIPTYANLSALGAYRKDFVYSTSDLQQIQEYAATLGVEVVIEIDSPGHSGSISYSRPDLITAFNIQPNWDSYAAEPPSGALKLNSSAVYEFLEGLYGDLLPRVKPYTSYFHTGGDEINVMDYLLDDTVRSDSDSVIQPLLQKFVDRNHAQIRANGLHPVVWEEMLLTWNLTLGSDVLIQTWESVTDSVALTVSKGHKALAGNYNYWYLDCGQGQWLDFYPNVSASWWPYNDYCSPRKNWRLMYSYDPLAGIPANETHLVVGGVVAIWSEQTDAANLDRMVWPRAGAAAEVLWSGAKDASGQNRSQVTASPRLADMRERLLARGVQAEPVHMPFCTMDGTQCGEIHANS
ncbi:MAG: N-acetyl-glucosamine-6-phosphate deacetylase [Bathelium mastoideum]|nr:MAG: N-acetyl-glucosamine-6-phosphate deacetylase [Bathelium mastoideum]